jgi:uracil phosphoribosyltransferase
MKDILLTTLRDRHSTLSAFRNATEKLGAILATEASVFLERRHTDIETPLATFPGSTFKSNIVLIPILRAGLALLPPFLKYYEEAKVGFVGMKRDEDTAIAHCYYENLPHISFDDQIIILEPMLATGGSACCAIKKLLEQGYKQEKMILVSIIGATEGVTKIQTELPSVHLVLAQYDTQLTSNKFILPGLGDFGDRYFGTL